MTSTAPARKDPTARNEERIAFLRVVVLLLGLAVGMSIPIEILLATGDIGTKKTVVQTSSSSSGSMAGMPGMSPSAAGRSPPRASQAQRPTTPISSRPRTSPTTPRCRRCSPATSST